MAERESAAPVAPSGWDATADVVVVGGGGATLGPIIAFAHRAANAAHNESRPRSSQARTSGDVTQEEAAAWL